MYHKVFFDTNLLLAGSIVETSGELGFQMKHEFYDHSTKLIEYIRKNPAKQIGIFTLFIESEAYNTISNAVETEIKKNVQDEEKEFNALSAVLNICTDNLRDIFTYFIRERVDDYEVTKIYYIVDSFYGELRSKARRINADLKRKKNKRVKTTPRSYKKIMREKYSQQDRWPYAQLLNLIEYKDIEPNDKMILSEVIYLHRLYKSIHGDKFKFYIASADYHFSPIRDDGRVSEYITRAIKNKYDIICDWPDKIYNFIKK